MSDLHTWTGALPASVRLAGSNRTHAVTAYEKSGMFHRALVPACGVSLGQPTTRIPTDEAVTCHRCLTLTTGERR